MAAKSGKYPTKEGNGYTAKRAKFRELAESRTNKALDAIGRIGNLSNKQVYEFEESEIKKIVKALRDSVQAVESRFDSSQGRSSSGFKL
jgi:hypothetical protein